MSNIPQIGQPAPDFSTPDQNDNPTTLSDLSGKWVVLYFYPKDDTPGCTTEAKDFSELHEDFSALEAKILGVSPDSGKSHCKFISKHNLSITLLSDPSYFICEKYREGNVDAPAGCRRLPQRAHRQGSALGGFPDL
jgi:peroxiredoxin Q/BCP